MAVDKIWYQFPLAMVLRHGLDQRLKTTICMRPHLPYINLSQKAFKLGSAKLHLAHATASGFGVKHDFDNGWAVSSNVVSKGGRGANAGFLTDQDTYKWDSMVAYTKDQYRFFDSVTATQWLEFIQLLCNK